MGERTNSFAVDDLTPLSNKEKELNEGVPTNNQNDLT